ncbi:MAG: radical SAM protein [Candidatus Nezhaarchaeales archaeon]
MDYKVILTADGAIMTDYSGIGLLGFGLCLPYRIIPKIVEYKILAPEVKSDSNCRALYAPYSLAKVEAFLLAYGFSRDEVAIIPPSKVEKAVSKTTRVVGISVLDPMGKAPVSYTLTSMFGGGSSCTKLEFLDLIYKIKNLKRKYGFNVIVGGPGVWQLYELKDKLGIDILYEGEAEITFPKIIDDIIRGKPVKDIIIGETPREDQIPPIVTPSRWGAVQITRGCPRKCHFCSPTTWNFRSMPLSTIMKEVKNQ